MSEKILLLDGNSLINRAFYAMPLLTNKNGEYTNGVYGFLNIFFKFIDEEKPDYCIVCFDVHKPTLRHIKYSEYKGTRKGMPQELVPQMDILKKVLHSMNIYTAEMGGFEADDLLGTFAKKADRQGIKPVIISGDRDLLQLASNRIMIRIPKTKGGSTTVENYTDKEVMDTYGVTPEEFIDVKALMGDTSDNVPGVPSIGEKTAIKIIQEYKTVENAIENADKIKPKKASENLTLFKEQALMSKWLVTIKTDVDYDVADFECAKINNMFNEESYNLFKEYEFKSMLKFFEVKEKPKADMEYITDVNIMDYIKDFDNVSYKLIIENKDVKVLSISCQDNKVLIVKEPDDVLLKEFFESDIEKTGHNVKEDIVLMSQRNIEIKNITFDTMLAGYILHSDKENYEYNEMAEDFLNESHLSSEEILGKGKSRKSVLELDENQFMAYCGGWSDISRRASFEMKKQLEENQQHSLYYDIELPLTFVLADMELEGMEIDIKALENYRDVLDKKLKELTSDIYWLAGEEFNINSPKQLSYILFEKLGLKGGKKTKTGWSTSADILEKLKDKDEIVGKVLEYRTFSKLKSTYADGLLSLVRDDNRIYSTFNQTVTTTGRISSTEPNLQNIPVRLDLGRELRKVFVAKKDCVYLDADYSQIELRVMADMAGDDSLINAFKNNQDIHRITASQVFNTPFDEVTDLQRRNAKAVNFGIIYGMGAFSLSQDLGITKKEADNYIKSYFEKYPKIKEFIDKSVEDARKLGYAKTIFNRRRYIKEINSSNFIQRSFGERVAMNMPVQGTAADIIKIAMVKVYNRLKNEGLKSKLILQVHDELIIETYENEEKQVAEILQQEMENAVKLNVPICAEVHSGKNWFEAK
jgi:DNA-directed DNA polymerase